MAPTNVTSCMMKLENTEEAITIKLVLEKHNREVDIREFFQKVLSHISTVEVEFCKGSYEVKEKKSGKNLLEDLPAILKILQEFCETSKGHSYLNTETSSPSEFSGKDNRIEASEQGGKINSAPYRQNAEVQTESNIETEVKQPENGATSTYHNRHGTTNGINDMKEQRISEQHATPSHQASNVNTSSGTRQEVDSSGQSQPSVPTINSFERGEKYDDNGLMKSTQNLTSADNGNLLETHKTHKYAVNFESNQLKLHHVDTDSDAKTMNLSEENVSFDEDELKKRGSMMGPTMDTMVKQDDELKTSDNDCMGSGDNGLVESFATLKIHESQEESQVGTSGNAAVMQQQNTYETTSQKAGIEEPAAQNPNSKSNAHDRHNQMTAPNVLKDNKSTS